MTDTNNEVMHKNGKDATHVEVAPQPIPAPAPVPMPELTPRLEQAIEKSEVLCDEAGALMPRSLSQMWRLAKYVHASGLAPKSFKTETQIFIAFAHGAELGVKPMQSLQFLCVVNGKVSIYGDAQLALAQPVLEYFREWYEDEQGRIDESKPGFVSRFNKAVQSKTLIACAEGKRRDSSEVVLEFFSLYDAECAGLAGKDGPWKQYPGRMLRWRARGWALRRLAADRFGGLVSREELEDEPEVVPHVAPQVLDLTARMTKKADAIDLATGEVTGGL